MNEINSKKPLDDHDEAILALLREDGRMAVRTIAERVGLNEATVRTRIRRLEQAGIMRVVARVDLGAAGFPFSSVISIESALALKIHKYVQPWGRFDEGN